jgi:hypothetical protein
MKQIGHSLPNIVIDAEQNKVIINGVVSAYFVHDEIEGQYSVHSEVESENQPTGTAKNLEEAINIWLAKKTEQENSKWSGRANAWGGDADVFGANDDDYYEGGHTASW